MTNRTYDQSSKSKDRTFDICEPKFLCIPEHSMHINTPRFKLAQSGSKNCINYKLNIKNKLKQIILINL